MTINKRMIILILIGLGIFFLARLCLFLFYFETFGKYGFTDIALSFINGVRFDLSIFLTLTSLFWVLLLIPINSILYRKIILWSMFFVYLAIGVFLFVDVNYFGYVNRHFGSEPFMMMNDVGFGFKMFGIYWLQTLIFLVCAAVVGYFWRIFVDIPTVQEKSWKKRGIYSLLWICVIFLFIRGSIDIKPIGTIDAFSAGDSNLGNLTLNGAFTSARFLSGKMFIDKDAYHIYDTETAEKIFSSGKSEGICSIPEELAKLDKPNIVFIMLESWSAYYVDFFANKGFGVTPNLDRLASEGLAFTRHYSPERRSILSIQAALTGIPPINGLPSLGFGLETMAIGNIGRYFADAGYDTIFIQSSKRRSFYMDSISKSLGFKKYYGMEDTKTVLDYPDKKGPLFGWDYETFNLLSDKLKEALKPFFAFIFTGTTHVPYARLPEEFMKFPHGSETEEGFKNTLYYSDWSLGQFFESIKNELWFKDTIFVITSDHNLVKFEETNYAETFRVPFVIWSPLFKKGAVIDNITSHIDIAPTLLMLSGNMDGDVGYLGESMFCKDDKSYAVLADSNTTGIVNKSMSLHHSFGSILDYEPKDLSEEKLKEAERLLLAYYQIAFDKVFIREH